MSITKSTIVQISKTNKYLVYYFLSINDSILSKDIEQAVQRASSHFPSCKDKELRQAAEEAGSIIFGQG